MSTHLVVSLFQKSMDHVICLFRMYIQRTEQAYLNLDQRLQEEAQRNHSLTRKVDVLEQRIQDLERSLQKHERRPTQDERGLERIINRILANKFLGSAPPDAKYTTHPPPEAPDPFDTEDMKILSKEFKEDFVWLRQNLTPLPRVGVENGDTINDRVMAVSKVSYYRSLFEHKDTDPDDKLQVDY